MAGKMGGGGIEYVYVDRVESRSERAVALAIVAAFAFTLGALLGVFFEEPRAEERGCARCAVQS